MRVKFQPAIVTGLLAGLIVLIADRLGIPGWVAFLTWTAQGFFKESDIGSLSAFGAFAVGLLVASGAAMVEQIMPATMQAIGPAITIGAACACVVVMGDWVRPRPAASAVFIGMIAWFGSRWTGGAPALSALAIASGLGLLAHRIATHATISRMANT